jgi:hypothetical protein
MWLFHNICRLKCNLFKGAFVEFENFSAEVLLKTTQGTVDTSC